VFIIATANDVSRLPPELLRRGRFDETFFLDLPTQREREEILRVHLRRQKRNPENFEVELLAERTEGYVGAELEQCVIDAMYQSFEDGQREVTTEDIADAIEAVIPLSHSQKERIEGLRSWLETGRARSASFVEKTEAQANSVNIEFGAYL
jgi:SpoVK/Ycf46/Vps4 family AAA+-type ATPase